MTSYLAQNTEQPRLSVMLLGGLGGLALLLAMIGIYGVVSYSVAQRTQEIGVRMALGATRRHVLRLVVGQATVLVAAGVVIGVGARSRWRRSSGAMLFEVSPNAIRRRWPPSPRRSTAVGVLASVLPGAPGDAGRSDRGAAGSVRRRLAIEAPHPTQPMSRSRSLLRIRCRGGTDDQNHRRCRDRRASADSRLPRSGPGPHA